MKTRYHDAGCGSSSSYNRGCRCHECRDAHAHLSLVWTRRNPEARHAIRHTACPECGGEMSRGNGTGRDPGLCIACYNAAREPEHGTLSRYQGIYKCRCEACRAANREHGRSLIGRTPPTHGLSGYKNYRCMCDICRAAGSLENRRYREARKRRQAA